MTNEEKIEMAIMCIKARIANESVQFLDSAGNWVDDDDSLGAIVNNICFNGLEYRKKPKIQIMYYRVYQENDMMNFIYGNEKGFSEKPTYKDIIWLDIEHEVEMQNF